MTQISACGPDGVLVIFILDHNSELQKGSSVVGVKPIAKQAAVTSHVWQEDADFIVSCTDLGHIILSNLGKSEVT